MPLDTTKINRMRRDFADGEPVWLFGYGSLIFKVDFPWLECRRATIEGWVRRFWQGSHDHRGTPEAPGRVLTLVEAPGAACTGLAYRVSPEVFDHLDYREKNGYLRFTTDMTLDDQSHARGLVYIATRDNAAFLGPAPEAGIARQVAAAGGPSGANSEYVLRLAEALGAMNVDDPHVFAVARHLDEQFRLRRESGK